MLNELSMVSFNTYRPDCRICTIDANSLVELVH